MFGADPLFSTNLTTTLLQLGKIIKERFWTIERGNPNIDQYLIEPKKITVLPSYFYWLPDAERMGLAGTLMQSVESLFRREGAENFPLLGVSGRAGREVMTLGGGVSLNTNFRVYLVVSAPPSHDLLERIGITLGHISRIVLAHIYYPPYWWFATVNEEEVVQRPDFGGLGYSAGFIGGNLRGMPHIAPYVPPP